MYIRSCTSIRSHYDVICSTGLDQLLDENRKHDLALLYRLYARVKDGLHQLTVHFALYIKVSCVPTHALSLSSYISLCASCLPWSVFQRLPACSVTCTSRGVSHCLPTSPCVPPASRGVSSNVSLQAVSLVPPVECPIVFLHLPACSVTCTSLGVSHCLPTSPSLQCHLYLPWSVPLSSYISLLAVSLVPPVECPIVFLHLLACSVTCTSHGVSHCLPTSPCLQCHLYLPWSVPLSSYISRLAVSLVPPVECPIVFLHLLACSVTCTSRGVSHCLPTYTCLQYYFL